MGYSGVILMTDAAFHSRAAGTWGGQSPIAHLEMLPVGAYTCDAAGLITAFNQHAERLWGRAPRLRDVTDRLTGGQNLLTTDRRPLPPEDCGVARVLRDGQRREGETYYVVRDDGQMIPVIAHSAPLFDPDGSINGAVSLVVDARWQVEPSHELSIRLRQQKTAEDLSTRAIAARDIDDFLARVVQTMAQTLDVEFCKFLELQPHDAPRPEAGADGATGGVTDSDVRPLLLRAGVGWQPGLVGTARLGISRGSQAGYTLRTKEPVIVHDLRTEARFSGPQLLLDHAVISGISVIVGEPDDPIGVLGAHTTAARQFSAHEVNFLQVIANITAAVIQRERVREQMAIQEQTERKRIEDALDAARAKLVVHTRLATLGQIAAQMAHDLRNPLGTVRNASHYLQQIATDDEAREFLDIIDTELAACESIIQNLLEVTRPRQPTRQPIPLERAVRDAFRRLRVGDACEFVYASDDPELTVLFDPVQMRQLLDNLLGNAVDAVGDAGRITVTAQRSGNAVRIDITDTGGGVPDELRDQIFNLLFTTKARGTGIGLTTCQQIVERHGGVLTLESATSGNTTFQIVLPDPVPDPSPADDSQSSFPRSS